MTALFSLHGTGASAEAMIPVTMLPNTSTQFVSEPVIQSLAETSVGSESIVDQNEQLAASRQAGSLDELVDAHLTDTDLSAEMRCLAGAIYFEARGESLEGQLAVGEVVVNRSKSGRFPSSYCGVVYQPSQFSFVRGGSMPSVRKNSVDWREAIAVAHIAHQGAWESEVSDALYFHATHVSPRWRLKRLARLDNHVFYR